MRRSLALLALALLVLPSCRTSSGGVAASTKPLEPGSYQVLGGRVTGRDTVVHLFGFIPLSDSNTTDDAMSDAIQNGGGDALIEVTADTWSSFWILWSEVTTEVNGVPVSSNR